jgi:hypothetical protein
MQTFYPDASKRFKSLDDIYYYGGQNAHNVAAVLNHKPTSNDQIQVKTGDLIGIAGNHWDGFSKGKNLRTNVRAPRLAQKHLTAFLIQFTAKRIIPVLQSKQQSGSSQFSEVQSRRRDVNFLVNKIQIKNVFLFFKNLVQGLHEF